MLLINLFNQFLKSISTVKKTIKVQFNKNLVMTEEEEHLFQQIIVVRFVKKLLIMKMKKQEIIVV